MPCNDYSMGGGSSYEDTRTIDRLNTQNASLAQKLCWLCGEITYSYDCAESMFAENPGLKEWWEEHQRLDAARINRDLEKFSRNRVEDGAKVLATAYIKKEEVSHPMSRFAKALVVGLAEEVVRKRTQAQREAKQAANRRVAALAKLTKEDREALGL